MRLAALLLAGSVAACGMLPQRAQEPEISNDRVDAFVTLVEVAGCELPHTENDHLLDPAGFSDAEASAISRRLLAEGRAEITPEGNLRVLTGECI